MFFERLELSLGVGELGFDDGELIEILDEVGRLLGRFVVLVPYVFHITKRIGTNRALC